MKKMLAAAVVLLLAGTANAHEVWIERDGAGPARIYLGEPEKPPVLGGDPEFAKLKAPRLLQAATGPMVRRAGHIEVAVPPGDVRAWDDAVFAPWGEKGAREGVVYYARAGRSEARATLPMEIGPVTAGGNRFRLSRNDRPVPGAEVKLIHPDRTTASLVTDADGIVTIVPKGSGRHLLTASLKEGADQMGGETVQTVYRIATTSFVAE